MRPLTAHQTFSRALGRGLHAPRLPCQLCPGAFSLGEGDLHPQLPALDACDRCRLKSLQFFSFLAFYPEPVTTALRQRTVTPTWQRYAVVAGAAGPRREPGPDNPPPCQTGVQGIRLPPGTRPGQEGTRPWYFRGAPLGLDVFPGMSGAGPGPSRSRITGCSARSAGYLWTSTTTSGSITGRAA